MTRQELTRLNLGLPIDTMTEIILNAGVEWVAANTTINTADIDNFPNCAKLFLLKFHDLQKLQTGVSSESIEGLSLSFDTSDKNALLWQFAEELMGQYLKGRVRFVQSAPRWR